MDWLDQSRLSIAGTDGLTTHRHQEDDDGNPSVGGVASVTRTALNQLHYSEQVVELLGEKAIGLGGPPDDLDKVSFSFCIADDKHADHGVVHRGVANPP